MKLAKRGLFWLLILCMALSMFSVCAFAEDTAAPVDVPEEDMLLIMEDGDDDYITDTIIDDTAENDGIAVMSESEADAETYKVFHLDCGRKYFSVAQIKAIIDTMAENDYNYLELALGNDGLRFLLDDMSLTTDYETYDSKDVKSAINAGNKAYCDCGTNELTQSEMDEIIAYAATKNISIIPLINTPGHMNVILSAMEKLNISNVRYNNSKTTVDLINNDAAVAFTKALLQKYITYFAGKGCKVFNLGCDEFANDINSNPQFAGLVSNGKYSYFVNYVNALATMVKNAGMKPMAFNDGIYYANSTAGGTFDSDIIISYWTSGWNGYNVAAAATLSNKGHKILNTNGSWYYVLNAANGTSWATAESNLSSVKYDSVQGATAGSVPVIGAMVCYWCDTPSYEYTETEEAHVKDMISVFAENNPAIFTVAEDTEDPDTSKEPAEPEEPEQTATVNPIEETVNLYVGETSETYTISGTNYAGTQTVADTSIATATVTGTNAQAASTTETAVTSVSNNTAYYIKNSDGKYLNASGKFVDGIDNAAEWTWNGSKLKNGNNYLRYKNGWTTDNNNATTLYFNDGTFYRTRDDSWNLFTGLTYTYSNPLGSPVTMKTTPAVTASTTLTFTGAKEGTTTVELKNADGAVVYRYTVVVSRKSDTVTVVVNGTATKTDTSAASATVTEGADKVSAAANGTTLTFTGLAVGTATVTTDACVYNVTVTEEDLTNKNVTLEYWITNVKVTGDDGATSQIINAATGTIYSANGASITELAPETGTTENGSMVYWKATMLLSTNKQTEAANVDKTKAGTDFTKIRYNGTWAVYTANGWEDVPTGAQLVAYYLQETNVTDEITTLVVDWGVAQTSYGEPDYVLLDYSVKYESGEEVPHTFTNDKTLAFHCAVSTYNDGYKYRTIGMVVGKETADYEVYMITATATSDYASSTLASTANRNGVISYNGTEKVVWAETQADLDNSGLGTWSSITGAYTYSIGGEPNVPGIEIYNKHGMKITYYVRAKVTEDALTVNYVNKTTGENFYNYNIAVKSGTLFAENIGLANPWKANLSNGSVKNIKDKEQTVSADLSTMPAIGVSYRYSDYTCTRVERSEDGKTVTLYYTFNNAHSYVVDFGLPLKITTDDLGINFTGATVTVTNKTYGDVAVESDGIRYTPNTVLKGVEQLSLNLDVEGKKVTHIIYIYPATTVYYEEGFATYSDGWNSTGSKGSGLQATQTAGKSTDEYGYDAYYAGDSKTYIMTEASSTTKGATATFEFTGTGIEIYANTTPTTAYMYVQIFKDGTAVKRYLVDTHMGDGTVDFTKGQAVEAYNVPVVTVRDLKYGNYSVVIRNMGDLKDPTVNKNNMLKLDGFRVFGTINDDTLDIYEEDLEDSPKYLELREYTLQALNVGAIGDSLNNEQIYDAVKYKTDGDGDPTTPDVVESAYIVTNVDNDDKINGETADDVQIATDILTNGPKNEVYLQPNQALVFTVYTTRDVQLGMKALNGTTKVQINASKTLVTVGSTDMFYHIDRADDDTEDRQNVTIRNAGDGILSITLLKICDDPEVRLGSLKDIDFTQALIGLGVIEAPAEEPEEEEPVEETPAEEEKPAVVENPFEDIREGAYYYGPVLWAVEKAITAGKDATHFAPADSCTRAQAVTFLYRAAGQPEPTITSCDFVDVSANAYYYKAVLWAVENGITSGVDATHFAPNETCTRAQIVTFLYRAAGQPEVAAADTAFNDVAANAYYRTAVLWAGDNGITAGVSVDRFAPADTCTRAQIVTFLYRAHK